MEDKQKKGIDQTAVYTVRTCETDDEMGISRLRFSAVQGQGSRPIIN